MFDLIVEKKIKDVDFNLDELTNEVVKTTLETLKLHNLSPISIVIVDISTIQNINLTCRNKNAPTDVLSFSFQENKLGFNPYLGEIYICAEKVYDQARENNHSIRREYCFLLIHGMLHVLGYNHINKDDEIIMFALQKQILNELKVDRNE